MHAGPVAAEESHDVRRFLKITGEILNKAGIEFL